MMKADQVIRVLEVCAELFLNPKEGERRFGDIVHRIGVEHIKRMLDPRSMEAFENNPLAA